MPKKTVPFSPSASEYILDNFASTDRIAMLVLNRDFTETVQRIVTESGTMEYHLHSALCQFALNVAGQQLFRLGLVFKKCIHCGKG